jgi:DNA-binding NtrC family response regulator
VREEETGASEGVRMTKDSCSSSGGALPIDSARLSLVGASEPFRATIELIQRLATCEATTLIAGETGTGKEAAARAIHYLSARRNFPFIPIHCGALPDSLLEAELFGHERGAFTDAKERRSGLVAEADGGALFLDEVEAMSPRAQVVLLRFLQDQKYRAVGGRQLCSTNVRIIAATNADLEEMVARGLFRQDLWFRLRVLELTLPALRDRPGDATLLAHHFLARFSERYARSPKRLHPMTVHLLESYSWPGNVRELESLMLREFLLRDDEEILIRPGQVPSTLPPPIKNAPPEVKEPVFEPVFKRAKAVAVAEFERHYLECLLARASGNITHAARLARKDRSALNKLVRKHGLFFGDFKR